MPDMTLKELRLIAPRCLMLEMENFRVEVYSWPSGGYKVVLQRGKQQDIKQLTLEDFPVFLDNITKEMYAKCGFKPPF